MFSFYSVIRIILSWLSSKYFIIHSSVLLLWTHFFLILLFMSSSVSMVISIMVLITSGSMMEQRSWQVVPSLLRCLVILCFSYRMYLLNGRLRSVAYVNQTPETIRYKENKNMKPDWRNQRWTNQQLQHTDKEPVITVISSLYTSCIGLSSWFHFWFL